MDTSQLSQYEIMTMSIEEFVNHSFTLTFVQHITALNKGMSCSCNLVEKIVPNSLMSQLWALVSPFNTIWHTELTMVSLK